MGMPNKVMIKPGQVKAGLNIISNVQKLKPIAM